MPYVERITKAGNTIEIERYFTSRYKKKGISRGDKVKPTKEEQEKVNTSGRGGSRGSSESRRGRGSHRACKSKSTAPFP